MQTIKFSPDKTGLFWQLLTKRIKKNWSSWSFYACQIDLCYSNVDIDMLIILLLKLGCKIECLIQYNEHKIIEHNLKFSNQSLNLIPIFSTS